MLRTLTFRNIYNTIKQVHLTSSATAPPALPSEKHGTSDDPSSTSSSTTDENPLSKFHINTIDKPKSPIVAAAFASLQQPKEDKILIDEKILGSKTPEDLLSLSEKTALNRKQALKIVTTLAEWSVNGLANMSTFETDPRFVSLCQLLGKSSSGTNRTAPGDEPIKIAQEQHEELSIVLGVTAVDEAAKVASTLSVPQMIKVLSSLATQKKRSLSLLRTLAFNIADSSSRLDIKKCADILFALSLLNFPDEVVLRKISNDLPESVPICERSSVIGSICTSLGRLRYRNDCLLDCLIDWIINNKDICRNQDLVSVLITLATVHHIPLEGDKFFEVIVNQLTEDDMPTASSWLDVVWSLVILGKATSDHYKSVLTQRFIQRIMSSYPNSSSIIWKKKMLNINGAAKLCEDYNGPLLDENKDISIVPLVRTKGKQVLVCSVLDALQNLLPSSAYLRSNIDSGMGFLIDGECKLDGNMTPMPLIEKKTGQPVAHKPGKGLRIAVMCWDYHDSTRGKVVLNGANALVVKLLNKTGYRVLSIDHSGYNVKDKLSIRMKYIEDGLKQTVRPKS